MQVCHVTIEHLYTKKLDLSESICIFAYMRYVNVGSRSLAEGVTGDNASARRVVSTA